VQAKLRESVSVKDFGAVGDGVADDTVAIQAAISAATSAGGGRIHFPGGTYRITDTLTINAASISLTGDAAYNSVIVLDSTTKNAIDVLCTSTAQYEYLYGCDISGLTIRPSVSSTGVGLRLSAIGRSRFEDLNIRDFSKALSVEGGLDNNFKNINVNYTRSTPTNDPLLSITESERTAGVYQPVYTASFQGCVIRGNTNATDTLLITSADGLAFSDCYFGNQVDKTLHLKIVNSYITGCYFTNCYFDGAKTDRTGGEFAVYVDSGGASVRVKFTSCYFANYGTTGVHLGSSANRVQLVNCEFDNIGLYGIHSPSGSNPRLHVIGCAFNSVGVDASGRGISVNGALVVTISNCEFLSVNGASAFGVLLTGTVTRKILDSNTFVNCTQWISDNATSTYANTGTFTPEVKINGVTTGITYTSRSGSFALDNGFVSFVIHIVLSSKGVQTGSVTIDGLPYAVSGPSAISAVVSGSGLTGVSGRALSTAQISLVHTTSGAPVAVADTNISNSSYFTVSGIYKTSLNA
jgi:hypothetical protein